VKKHLILLLALATFAACENKADDDAVPADSSVAANADTATQVNIEPVVVKLDDVKDSGIEGEATATHSANEVTVSIVLKDGAKPDVTYPAHIHTGTCKTGGPVAVELAAVTNLQSSKTVPLSSLPANQDAFVQVHDPKGTPVACGDMPGHGDGHMNADSARTTTTSQ
jgi:hypothetical protein